MNNVQYFYFKMYLLSFNIQVPRKLIFPGASGQHWPCRFDRFLSRSWHFRRPFRVSSSRLAQTVWQNMCPIIVNGHTTTNPPKLLAYWLNVKSEDDNNTRCSLNLLKIEQICIKFVDIAQKCVGCFFDLFYVGANHYIRDTHTMNP